MGPTLPGAATATPGATATPAAAAAASGDGSSSNNSNGAAAATATATKLRACAGPFEICPAPALCRNPKKGNEWCFWLYVDKASCVCL